MDDFLDKDPEHYGLSGSPTQVERIFPPENDVKKETWTGEGSGERLFAALKTWKYIADRGVQHAANCDLGQEM